VTLEISQGQRQNCYSPPFKKKEEVTCGGRLQRMEPSGYIDADEKRSVVGIVVDRPLSGFSEFSSVQESHGGGICNGLLKRLSGARLLNS